MTIHHLVKHRNSIGHRPMPHGQTSGPLQVARHVFLAMSLSAASLAWAKPVDASHPDAAATALDGIDPRVYLQSRLQRPNVAKALAAAPPELAVAVLRASSVDSYLAPRAAYPAAWREAVVDQAREGERTALLTGAAFAVAKHAQHGRIEVREAHGLLLALTTHQNVAVASEATEQLGLLPTDAHEPLARLLRDARVDVRRAACVGLAHQRTDAAFALLLSALNDDADPERQHAAVAAVAAFASPWAWQALHQTTRGEAYAVRAVEALRALQARKAGGDGVTSALAQLERR